MSAKNVRGPANNRQVLQEVRQRYRLDGGRRVAPKPPARKAARPPQGPTTPITRNRRSGGGSAGKSSRSKTVRRALLVLFFIIIAGLGAFSYRILAAGNKISAADQSILGQLKDLLFSSGEFLDGEQDGRVNVLLIAVGGEGHKGSALADTIMVASIKPETNDIALLSIPRDLYVQVPGEEYHSKINSVHAYGESQKKDNGPKLLIESVEQITGQPIHYYARADFTAFKGIVDAVGGVNITIENEFYDFWHKITFPAGTEKMNGERALAYVRARYVEGSEGGDFKRAARQQQVLLALREKVFSVNTALDFGKVSDILNSLADNIRTDMQIWEMKRFFDLARATNPEEVHSVVLSTGHNGVLVGGTEILSGQPASILRPRAGDYSEIQSIATNIFSEEVSTTITPTSDPAPITETADTAQEETQETVEKPTIEVRNGTNINGLAARTQSALEDEGFTVETIGNAATRTVEKTVVYQLANTAATGAQEIAELLEASASTGLPEGEAESSAQVLVILGSDAE